MRTGMVQGTNPVASQTITKRKSGGNFLQLEPVQPGMKWNILKQNLQKRTIFEGNGGVYNGMYMIQQLLGYYSFHQLSQETKPRNWTVVLGIISSLCWFFIKGVPSANWKPLGTHPSSSKSLISYVKGCSEIWAQSNRKVAHRSNRHDLVAELSSNRDFTESSKLSYLKEDQEWCCV